MKYDAKALENPVNGEKDSRSCVTMQELLEQDRERLISAVSGAEPGAAIRGMNDELDRILYAFNDREENAAVREAAGSMMQVAKAACSLVDSAGETKIYGRTEYGMTAPDKGKIPKAGLLLLILGLIAAAAAVIGGQLLATSAAAASADWQSAGLPPRWLLAGVPLLASAALFFAGMLLRRRREPAKETLRAETTVDASLIYTRLLSMILVMDKRLEELRSAARQEEKARLNEQALKADSAELELLAGLLEDAYARRGEDEQAEEAISQIRFYLHRKGIEVVDWTSDAVRLSGKEGVGKVTNGAWFDMMPAYAEGTLRPALAADGKLLKKGLASAGRG